MAFWHRPTRFGWDASSLTDRPLALVLPVGKARERRRGRFATKKRCGGGLITMVLEEEFPFKYEVVGFLLGDFVGCFRKKRGG